MIRIVIIGVFATLTAVSTFRVFAKSNDAVRFDPPVLVTKPDSSGFVQSKVYFYSNTGDTVRITRIDGSCKCGSATVQRPLTHDSTPGMFYVMVNTNHVPDSVIYVDYTITFDRHPQQYFRVIVNK